MGEKLKDFQFQTDGQPFSFDLAQTPELDMSECANAASEAFRKLFAEMAVQTDFEIKEPPQPQFSSIGELIKRVFEATLKMYYYKYNSSIADRRRVKRMNSKWKSLSRKQ